MGAEAWLADAALAGAMEIYEANIFAIGSWVHFNWNHYHPEADGTIPD